MLLYGWTIVILYLCIINGRLEADINKSVESHCVLLKSSHHNWCRDQDFLLSTGGGGLEERKKKIFTEHISRTR